MIGAALGKKLEDAHAFVDQHKILIGVIGKHDGIMKDLWNYRKLTNKAYTLEQIKKRNHYSILIREYLYNNQFTFFFAAENKTPLKEICDAFHSPHYALTVGNSDDLLKICSISKIDAINEENEIKIYNFENTVVPGDISKKCRFDKEKINFENLPIVYTLYTPQVFLLPTKFKFEGDERRVIEKKLFTFIHTPVTLSTPLDGYCINGKAVVLQ